MRAAGQPAWPDIDAGKAIPWVERTLGVTLARSQREAVTMAVSSKAMVITGGPTRSEQQALPFAAPLGACLQRDPKQRVHDVAP